MPRNATVPISQTNDDELESSTDPTPTNFDFVGDTLEESPNEHITRIYIQNLNGLNWDGEGGKWPYVCDAMDSIQADIGCFSEINTDTNIYSVRNTMEKVCRQQFNQNRLILSSSRQTTASHYKPGGTAILACNSITAFIKKHTRDRMGRWSSVSISSEKGKNIRIISAYQVCRNTRPGANTAAAHQQAQIIIETAQTDTESRITPREAFIQDLQAFIQQLQSEGEAIVLVGDFNEGITDPDSGLDRLATSCELADLFSVRLGSPMIPATYQRGTKRLDYVLMSPELLPHVRAAGYEPYGYRIPSDHRGMYVDFDTEALLHHDLIPLAAASTRDFSSKSPEVIQRYVTAKTEYLVDHRFFERLSQLEESTTPDHEKAEALDRDFQRASLHGARKASKKKRSPWSPQLAEVWAELHYYKLAKSALTNCTNYLPVLQHLQRKWPHLPTTIPQSSDHIQQAYENTIKKMKTIRLNAQQLREEFLLKQALIYKEMQQQGKAKILQRMVRAESQKKVHQKIRYLRNQQDESSGICSIKVPRALEVTDTEAIKLLPDTPEFWETITVPPEIERLLLLRNRHHFSQAEGTPFTETPLKAAVGYKADGYSKGKQHSQTSMKSPHYLFNTFRNEQPFNYLEISPPPT